MQYAHIGKNTNKFNTSIFSDLFKKTFRIEIKKDMRIMISVNKPKVLA